MIATRSRIGCALIRQLGLDRVLAHTAAATCQARFRQDTRWSLERSREIPLPVADYPSGLEGSIRGKVPRIGLSPIAIMAATPC